MADSTFSINIGEHYTSVCEIKNFGNQIEVVSMGYDKSTQFYISSESDKIIDEQAHIIAGLCNKLRISKKNVNVVIPDSLTYSQIIEMPKLREKELLAAIRYQADEFIPMPIDETILDLEILREDEARKKLLILIVASPKKLVEQIEKTVDKAHLIADSLENELSAVGRLVSEVLKPKAGGATLFINFGYSSTSIYLYDNTTALVTLIRTFKMGLNLFIKDIRVNLNWDEEKIVEILNSIGFSNNGSYNIETIVNPLIKELMNEIEKFLTLAKEKYNLSVNNIYLFNMDNHIAHIAEKIQAFFSLPTQSLSLNTVLKPTSLIQSYSNRLSLFVPVIASAVR